MWMPFSPGKSLPVVWWNLAKEKVRGPTPGPAGERNVCEIGVKRWTKTRRVIHFFGHRSVQGENGKWKFMREHNKIQKEAMILWILMPDKSSGISSQSGCQRTLFQKAPLKLAMRTCSFEQSNCWKNTFLFLGGRVRSLPKIETCWRLSKKKAPIFLDFLKIFGTWTPVWTFGVVGYDMYNVYIHIISVGFGILHKVGFSTHPAGCQCFSDICCKNLPFHRAILHGSRQDCGETGSSDPKHCSTFSLWCFLWSRCHRQCFLHRQRAKNRGREWYEWMLWKWWWGDF